MRKDKAISNRAVMPGSNVDADLLAGGGLGTSEYEAAQQRQAEAEAEAAAKRSADLLAERQSDPGDETDA